MELKQGIILAIFLFSFPLVFAQEIPSLQKYVNDYAGVLSPSDTARINSLAGEIERNTTVQIVVLTVNTTQPMTIEEYAVKVFEKNGIGHKDTDNGLLIVEAVEDRQWKLEIGYGLEPIINDAKAGLIGRTYFTDAFRQQQYGEGIYNAVDAINKVIQSSGDTSFISGQPDNFVPWIVVMIVFLALIPVLIILFSARDMFFQKCPKCGSGMRRRYVKDGVVYECPKCGKKIKTKRKRRFWFFYAGYGGWHGGGGGGSGGGGGFGGGGSGGGGASGGY